MATITLQVTEEFKAQLESIPWVNWSEIARQELKKKLIFDNYIKKGKITDEEWKFCEINDWHPVDELPITEKFKKELIKRKNGKFIKLKSAGELFKEE